MADRSSVIEALEEAIPFMQSKGYGAVAHIMHDAVELLKEQELTKVKTSAAEPVKLVRTECIDYVCAECFHKVGLKHKDKDVWYYRDDECINCGRGVKWDA